MGRQTRASTKAKGKGKGKAAAEEAAPGDAAAAAAASAAASVDDEPSPTPAQRARAAPKAARTTATKVPAPAKAPAAKLTADRKKRVAAFVKTTGASEDDAVACLEAVEAWDVEAAVDHYYTEHSHAGGGPRRPGGARGVEALFRRYKEPDADRVGVDGILRMCADVGVDPTDISMLVLAFHMGASAQGELSRPEFASGLAKLGVDCVDRLRARLPDLRAQLAAPEGRLFRDVYAFAYGFSCEKGQKCVQLESAVAMWRLLLGEVPGHTWPLVGEWCDFLVAHHGNRAVTRDTWTQLHSFATTVKPDFSNWDEHSAWPFLIDEFVDHMKAKRVGQ